MTAVGELGLWVALFLAVWAAAASIVGARLRRDELVVSSARAVAAATAMVGVACVGLWWALLDHDFSIGYVASHTTLNMPAPYLLIALWAGPAGRLLFLALALSCCAAIAVGSARRLDPSIRASTIGGLATLLALLLTVVCFGTNPYDRLEWVPAEGQGLDPRLQTALAAAYFVATYVGYAAASVVLALGVSAAFGGRLDRPTMVTIRVWCTICWCLLTVALAVHMRWSYLDPESRAFQAASAPQVTTAIVWAATFVALTLVTARQVMPGARALRTRSRIVSVGVLGLGLVMIAAGLAATRFWADRSVSLNPGETVELRDRFGRTWRFVSQGVSRDEQVNHLTTSVALEVWRDGEREGFVSAERRQYLDSVQRPTFEPTLRPGVASSPTVDVYVLFTGLRSDAADLRVGFRPLVRAVWLGWVLVGVGGLAFLLPLRRRAEHVATPPVG